MKKGFLWLVILLVTGGMTVLPGCKQREKDEEGADSQAKEESTAKKKPQTKVVLTCGMAGHPQFAPGEEPADGRCPQCEMKLKEKEVPVEKAE
jgi:hypothetical protein